MPVPGNPPTLSNTEQNQNNIEKLTGNLFLDLDTFKKIFFYPKNKDFMIRPIHINALNVDGAFIYINGSIDVKMLTKDIIPPLMEDTLKNTSKYPLADIIKKIITAKNAQKISNNSYITTTIVKGNAVLLIQGSLEGISILTTEFEHRSVEKPVNENTIKGPKEAFVESAHINSVGESAELFFDLLIFITYLIRSFSICYAFKFYKTIL